MRRPKPPPRLDDIIQGIADKPHRLQRMVRVADEVDERYLHWDQLRWRPLPDGLESHEEWWLATKWSRSTRRVPGFDGVAGRPFVFGVPDTALELLHHIDGNLMGQIAAPEEIVNPGTRTRFLFSSLVEEAVRSSQLEGAVTSRKQAQTIIRLGTRPRTRDELMIVNNYRAMEFVREVRRENLSPELVLELHRIVTEGTLDNPDAAGRLQRPDEDRVKVWDEQDHVIVHEPPPAEDLPGRLKLLCDFANAQGQQKRFLHPVIRSIILHFWLAYDHPFEDGNGRTARALFYWSMLHHNYWLAEYISISRILKTGPAQYARAFLFTETDDNDLTYFVLHQLRVIDRAIDALKAYLVKKSHEVSEVKKLVASADLNHRQVALLGHALRNPLHAYTYMSHATSHRVVRQTARTDLNDLADRGLLVRRKIGTRVVFVAPDDLAERLRGIAAASNSKSRGRVAAP